MTPEEEAEFKRRQKARNLVVAGALLFFVVLFYLITIARLGSQ
ncbi:MAG: hypothetical protein QNI87_00820 [Erythrobacter sp.]|nr:hypothetical protein [Erythrobacter sp.]MDJ0977059.1 hypothetical protein [Erythrobacter sp.]